MKHRILLAILSVLMLATGIAWATTTTQSSTRVDVQGLGVTYVTVAAATSGDVVATDTGLYGSKRAHIVRMTAGGQTLYCLIRVQKTSSGVFVDEIAAETSTALATAITGFNLSTTLPAHPSPTHDAVDDAAAALMVGYAGTP